MNEGMEGVPLGIKEWKGGPLPRLYSKKGPLSFFIRIGVLGVLGVLGVMGVLGVLGFLRVMRVN